MPLSKPTATDIIRVEMARDLKANAKQRAEDDRRNKENEKKNKIAEERLGEYGLNPTRNDIIKYKLWEECEHLCPYTGKTISMDALFGDSPRFDIEHIIPYSRSLDDSFMNKTLCEKGENERKANHTPYEHYSGNQVIYGEILARVKKLPYPKRKRFTMENLDDVDFVSQQLNETRYIARQTVTFLGQLGVNVQPVKGGTTALLRRAWALNGILSNDGEKTREDHRHHAIDALVVALTDRRAVQRLSRYHTLSYRGLRIENYPEPITDLRQHATKAVGKITVSHKTNRKVQGALHKEFLYGLTGNTDTKGVPEVVIRKPLVELSKQKDLHHIRDPKIRQMALEHFARSQNFKDAFANPENPFGFRDKQGRVTRPIKKVRLVYQRTIATIGSNDESIRHQRNVWTRNNHHIEIIEFTDVKGRLKWRGEVVNMLEAATRKRHGQPVVTIQHGKDERFVMTVHKEDVFSLNHQGQALICRVQKFDQNGLIALRTHTDASQDSQKFIYKTPETLRQSGARLLTISPLGKVATPHE